MLDEKQKWGKITYYKLLIVLWHLYKTQKNMMNEIVLYQSDELLERIEVKIEDDTVWLTQQQMATLFMQTKQNISLHINNCFNENELQAISVVKESLTTANDGKKYKTK